MRDGKFEFVVTAFECPDSPVGVHGSRAKGRWCVVTVRATNIADGPATLFASDSPALDGQGREFAPSGDETSGTLAAEDMNPDQSVVGALWYDIPPGVDLVEVELHDSMWSGGVKVSLSG